MRRTSNTKTHVSPTYGVLTALPKEFAAVKAMLDAPVEASTSGRRPWSYVTGTIPARGGGVHHVAAVLLPSMGNNSAATRAGLLLNQIPSVKQILMVGIAGASPNPNNADEHVRLGDIVVSGINGIAQYDYVSEKINETVHRHPPRPPSAMLLEAVRHLEADDLAGQRHWIVHISRAKHLRDVVRPEDSSDQLAATPPEIGWVQHPVDSSRQPGEPRVFLGTIGSANVLLRDPRKRDSIRDKFGVRAFEMESSGIADAAWDQECGYLVIRGTCDYCDSNKSDLWQGYAAVAAASYFRGLLETLPAEIDAPQISGSHSSSATLKSQVADIYRLMHYDVEERRVFGNRSSSLFLTLRHGDLTTYRAIECIPTTPTGKDIDKFAAFLRAAKRELPFVTGTVVSSLPPSERVSSRAKDEGIMTITLDTLSASLLHGTSYARWLCTELESNDRYPPQRYVDSFIGYEISGSSNSSAEVLDEWLADSEWNQLTLLGDVGTGKTFLSRILTLRLAQEYLQSPNDRPLPILIDLRNADRLLKLEGIVLAHLQQVGLERVSFATFQHSLKTGKIILILDGFDEMAARVTPQITTRNFHEFARCVTGRSKVLLTCRTHYFKSRSDEEEVILGSPGEYESEGARELYWDLVTRRGFRIAYLRPFETQQIEEYVARARPKDAKESIARIRKVYDLIELSRRPMLLEMVVKSIDRLGDGEVTAATLYRVFTDIWIRRDEWREVLTPSKKLELMTSLAVTLWASGAPHLHHRELFEHLRRQSDAAIDAATILEIDNEMRTASFLVRDNLGNYGFAHKSYAEFFIAQHLTSELEAGRVECLNVPFRVSREITSFMRDLAKTRTLVDRVLCDTVTAPYHTHVSENALICLYGIRRLELLAAGAQQEMPRVVLPDEMLLQNAKLERVTLDRLQAHGAKWEGAVLSGATIVGGDLSFGDFTDADCSGINLRNCVLRSVRFVSTKLDGADLSGCELSSADLSNVRMDRAAIYKKLEDPLSRGRLDQTNALSIANPWIRKWSRHYSLRGEIEPEDLEQEIRLQLLVAMEKGLDAARLTERFVASLFVQAIHRQSMRTREVSLDEAPEERLIANGEDPEATVINRDVFVRLKMLDPKAQLIITMWADGASMDEISYRTELSTPNVLRRLKAAREVIKKSYDSRFSVP